MEPEDIFKVFEGVCPKCGADVKIKSVGGTRYFLRTKGWGKIAKENGAEITVWRDSPDPDAIGGINYVCPNGHESYVECTVHEDWV